MLMQRGGAWSLAERLDEGLTSVYEVLSALDSDGDSVYFV